jgi:hypothetical protein
VQDKRVDSWPEFGHYEWDTLRYQARDERDISAEPIELGDHDGAPEDESIAAVIGIERAGRR